jgi:hypothetical protein
MRKMAAVIRTVPIVLLLGLPGNAQAAPLHGIPDLLKLLEPNGSSVVQPAHCRPFVHTHRRCVRWRRGYLPKLADLASSLLTIRFD